MYKYEIILYWSNEDAAFIAEVPELPGCMAHGDSRSDALKNVNDAMQLWIDTAREFGGVRTDQSSPQFPLFAVAYPCRKEGVEFVGEATTDADARFRFRTYVPGRYAARPAQHIHYKVRQGERELLTSQMYFAELGGARGLSRSAKAELQTVNLERIEDGSAAAAIEIVI